MRTVVVMPAYYAESTIAKTVASMPKVYERIILCDDGSRDRTFEVARELGLETVRHSENRGYGANQKTLYDLARRYNPDVVVMVHPDNQYDTAILPKAIAMIERGEADLVLGTRMATARQTGMPWWKRLGNRFLSNVQRWVFKSPLSEFHSGLRIFRASLLEQVPYRTFSDDFVFDSQCLAWCFGHGQRVRELPTQCYYNREVSSINFRRSVRYGLATLRVLATFRLGQRYHR